MKKIIYKLLCIGIMAQGSIAFAENAKPLIDLTDKTRWLMRFRAIDVMPDENSTVTGLSADVKADNDVMPEVDFSYFFTDHIAAELILATTKHAMSTNTGVDLGDVWVLPPTLTLQYHFNTEGKIQPYAGAGIGYIMYYNEDPGAVSSIKYQDGVSYALQGGIDYKLDDHWLANVDVKKLYHNTDVSINGGAITADVDLDPWVLGVGVGYRF